jgi:CPA1 family monovalent cation:H+ antiporter
LITRDERARLSDSLSPTEPSLISTIQILAPLLAVIAAVATVAVRIKIPPSILLVSTGVVLALIPGLPTVEIAPDFMLLVVLPPIVYDSAVSMSWREFRFNLRPIALLAVGCVLFTTAAVAAAAHVVLALSWPVGFLLGAIVSPPDAVAPLSIARRLKLPKRILVILEGEGLANDATALILYRFAVAAASTGEFSLGHAALAFSAIIAGEIVWGIGVGWLMLRLRRWVRDPRIEITLSVLTPFLAFWPPQHLGGSGVLATVTAGLYVSWNGFRLISAATRLQGIFFWDFLIYLIEGMVFLITGLQARAIVANIGEYSISQLARSALLVTAVMIVARFVWMYPATYLPRWLVPAVRRADPSPPWQWPFALAYTGVRGIVSLAAALAIPLATRSGDPFPQRDLILFLTFCVILVTLVGQGAIMAPVMRLLGLVNAGRRERYADRVAEQDARRQAAGTAAKRFQHIAAEKALPDNFAETFRKAHFFRLQRSEIPAEADGRDQLAELHDEIALQLIAAERDRINDLYCDNKLTDEARRRLERELDLREARVANARGEE